MKEIIRIRYLLLTCYTVDGLLEMLSECGKLAGNATNPLNGSEKESLEDLISDIESRLQILNSSTSRQTVRAVNNSERFTAKIFLDDSTLDKSILPMPVDLVRLQAIYKDDYHIPPSTQCYIGFETFPAFILVKFKYYEMFLNPYLRDRTALNERSVLSGLTRDEVLEIDDKYEHFISDSEMKKELDKVEIIEFEPFGLGELRKEYIRLAIDELGPDKELISQVTGIPVKRVGELMKTFCEYKEFDGVDDTEGEDE